MLRPGVAETLPETKGLPGTKKYRLKK